MTRRFLDSLGVAVVMAGLFLFLHQAAAGQTPASNQPQSNAPQGGAVPKTAWGHPDIQGIWLDEFDTPLERHRTRSARATKAATNARRSAAGRTSPALTTRCSPPRNRLADGRRSLSTPRTAE